MNLCIVVLLPYFYLPTYLGLLALQLAIETQHKVDGDIMQDEQGSDSDNETVSNVETHTLLDEANKSLEAAHALLPESDCVLFYRLKVLRHPMSSALLHVFPTNGLTSRLCFISLLLRRTSKAQSLLWMSSWQAFLITRLVIGGLTTRPTKTAFC